MCLGLFRCHVFGDSPRRVTLVVALQAIHRQNRPAFSQPIDRPFEYVGYLSACFFARVFQRSAAAHLFSCVSSFPQSEHIAGFEVAVILPQFACLCPTVYLIVDGGIGLQFVFHIRATKPVEGTGDDGFLFDSLIDSRFLRDRAGPSLRW